MTGVEKLPRGWAMTTLGDLIEPRRIKANPQVLPTARFIGLEHVEAHTTKLLGTTSAAAMKSSANAFKRGDVLYGRLRPYLNKVCQTDFDGLCSGEFVVMPENEAVSGAFLEARLSAYDFVHFASHLNAGDRPRVDFGQLRPFSLALPPKGEQTRITDLLAELFNDLDAGIAALERCRENLNIYRASLLKTAVEGDLTADWRGEHPDAEPAGKLLQRILAERRERWEQEQIRTYAEKGKAPPKNWKAKYKEPVLADRENLPSLPKSWSWVSLDQLGKIDRGLSKHRPRNADFLYGGPYPFVQTSDVKRAHRFLQEHTQTYSESGLEQSRLWPQGTLCITIAANIAETAILTYPACFPDSIVGILFPPSLVSVEYVELFIQSVKNRISVYAPATAQKNINNQILRKLAVALPPVAEQRTIVAMVEEQLSTFDEVAANVEAKLKESGALRQSILHSAFSGKLVPQDPSDEPASKLLERIANEREARAMEGQTPSQCPGQSGEGRRVSRSNPLSA